jgi:DNA-binding transcriptional LysR family regulator
MGALLPNLRHLLALREVARAGSVSAAAHAVHLSQPAVTQAVAKLERTMAATLFERGPRGMTATAAGTIVLARFERALAQLREGIDEALRGARPALGDPLRSMTAAQLEALVGVAEHGDFGRAARAGRMARTTIHRAARQLERGLNVPLFEPTSHGLRPTRAAERLACRVRLAATEIQQARAEVAALGGREGGASVIGAMPLARSVLVPRAVLEFCARRPGHRIEVLDGPYENLLDALRRGRADVLVGAMREQVPVDVRQEHLFDDPLAIIVRAGHPLALGRRPPSIEALARFPWIAPRAGSPLRRHHDALVPPRSTASEAPIECNSLVAARAMLVASDRVMLLSGQQVELEQVAGQLVALPHPRGVVRRQIGLTYRRDWQPTVAQSELLAALRRVASAASARDGSNCPVDAESGLPGHPQPTSAPQAVRNARGDTRMRRVKKRAK